MFAVTFELAFAVKVFTVVPFFWIVNVALFTVGKLDEVINPLSLVISLVLVGTVMLAVLLLVALAVNVWTFEPFFCIVNVAFPTEGIWLVVATSEPFLVNEPLTYKPSSFHQYTGCPFGTVIVLVIVFNLSTALNWNS